MALGDTLRRIVASDNFILNAAGALVGIKNPNANGLDLRVDQPAAYLPYILAQTAVPAILPSSGSSNATGQITLTTALPYVPIGTASLYLPAGVVVGDATGGMKAAVFSSTTVCQLVGAPATANASYTQTTAADLTLVSVTVPGGAMGANGALRVTSLWGVPNNANSKGIRTVFGGVGPANGFTTAQGIADLHVIRNRGTQAAQTRFSGSLSFGGTTVANNATSVDTSVSQALTLVASLTAATDYVIVEGYTIEVLPAA